MTSLDTKTLINPFLDLPLENLYFDSPKIENRQVFYSEFGHNVTLTPLAQGIHLPENIYTYMDDNFFN